MGTRMPLRPQTFCISHLLQTLWKPWEHLENLYSSILHPHSTACAMDLTALSPSSGWIGSAASLLFLPRGACQRIRVEPPRKKTRHKESNLQLTGSITISEKAKRRRRNGYPTVSLMRNGRHQAGIPSDPMMHVSLVACFPTQVLFVPVYHVMALATALAVRPMEIDTWGLCAVPGISGRWKTPWPSFDSLWWAAWSEENDSPDTIWHHHGPCWYVYLIDLHIRFAFSFCAQFLPFLPCPHSARTPRRCPMRYLWEADGLWRPPAKERGTKRHVVHVAYPESQREKAHWII